MVKLLNLIHISLKKDVRNIKIIRDKTKPNGTGKTFKNLNVFRLLICGI